jgi:hypothetical protein
MLFGNTSSFYRPAGYKDPYAPMAQTAAPTPTAAPAPIGPNVVVGAGSKPSGIAKPTYGAPAPTAQPAPLAPYPSTLQTSAPAPAPQTTTTETTAEPDDEYQQMMDAYIKQLQASAANPTPYGAEYYNQGGQQPAPEAAPVAAAAAPAPMIPAMNIPKPNQDPGAGWGTGYQQVKMPTGLGQGGGSNPIAALRAARQGGGLY